MKATGGTITYDGLYTIHTFTSSGDFVVSAAGDAEVLCVSGGGGGGGSAGAGGGAGAGGVKYTAVQAVLAQTYASTIGAGGVGTVSGSGTGANGGGSSLGALISALGGGGGGGYASPATTAPNSGGSGGGGGSSGTGSFNGASGAAGEGSAGGNGRATTTQADMAGGGGGGKGAVGAPSTASAGGNGGIGAAYSISGSSVYYGGGGGGGKRTTQVAGTGGNGGGGNGGLAGAGSAGAANTGGGGGGGGAGAGGNGGSGIIIIKYLTATFEDWVETDAGTGIIEIETSSMYAGLQSAKLTNGIGGANVVKLSQTLTVIDGIKYVFSGYVKSDWQLDIVSGANSATDTGTDASWTIKSVTVIADGTSLTVTLQPDGDSDVAYFDAMVVASSYPTDFEHLKFIGTMVDIDPSSGVFDNPVTTVVAHDWIGYLNKQELGVQAIQSDKRADEALTTILTEFPNQPEATDFDTGVETFEIVFAGDSGDSSMARMFAKLARNERGRIFSEGDGTLRFEKQGTRDGSQDSAFTIDGTMSEFDVTYSSNNIYNTVALDVKTQIVDAAATTELFKVGQGVPITAGQTITITCNFTDPDTGQSVAGSDVVTPVAAPHFGSVRTPASDDMNANLTHDNYQVGGSAITVDLNNNHATDTGYLNEFTVLGKRITDYDKITITKKNQASIDQVGNSKYTNRLDLIEDPTVAEDIASGILTDYAPSHTSRCQITVLANISSSLAAQLVLAEPSTKFTAIESITGISKDFYIDNIRYKQDHTLLWVTIEAEEA